MNKSVVLASLLVCYSVSVAATPALDLNHSTGDSEVKLDISVKDTGGVRINEIPSSWELKDSQDDGAFFVSNISEGFTAWAWSKDVESADLGIRFERNERSNSSIKVTAENSEGESDSKMINFEAAEKENYSPEDENFEDKEEESEKVKNLSAAREKISELKREVKRLNQRILVLEKSIESDNSEVSGENKSGSVPIESEKGTEEKENEISDEKENQKNQGFVTKVLNGIFG